MLAAVASTMIALCGATDCALPDPATQTELDYASMRGYVLEEGDARFVRHAPVFLVEGYEEEYNRIGTPSARLDANGEEEIYVDATQPTYYLESREWTSGARRYTNLIYRVHFEQSKSNSNSRDGGNGRNVGVMVIVTLDEEDKPVYVNSVQTCGCFHAVLPTNFTSPDAYPDWWNMDSYTVYGETLPGRLTYPEDFGTEYRPVVFLRDGNHRTANMLIASIGDVREKYPLITAAAEPMEALKHLKLGDGETSFYYESGDKKGLVKGAYKRGEAFLLGAFVGDGRVGQDRIYGGDDELPRGFYTSIKRGEKNESDMWDYKPFLELDGWKP